MCGVSSVFFVAMRPPPGWYFREVPLPLSADDCILVLPRSLSRSLWLRWDYALSPLLRFFGCAHNVWGCFPARSVVSCLCSLWLRGPFWLFSLARRKEGEEDEESRRQLRVSSRGTYTISFIVETSWIYAQMRLSGKAFLYPHSYRNPSGEKCLKSQTLYETFKSPFYNKNT